jgi:hypothetical protein
MLGADKAAEPSRLCDTVLFTRERIFFLNKFLCVRLQKEIRT